MAQIVRWASATLATTAGLIALAIMVYAYVEGIS